MDKRICMLPTCAFLLASAVTAAAQGTNAGQKIDRAIRNSPMCGACRSQYEPTDW